MKNKSKKTEGTKQKETKIKRKRNSLKKTKKLKNKNKKQNEEKKSYQIERKKKKKVISPTKKPFFPRRFENQIRSSIIQLPYRISYGLLNHNLIGKAVAQERQIQEKQWYQFKFQQEDQLYF